MKIPASEVKVLRESLVSHVEKYRATWENAPLKGIDRESVADWSELKIGGVSYSLRAGIVTPVTTTDYKWYFSGELYFGDDLIPVRKINHLAPFTLKSAKNVLAFAIASDDFSRSAEDELRAFIRRGGKN